MKILGKKYSKRKKQERGFATIEALPLLVVFVVLISCGIGLFGAIHTAILYSIAARTYAFETFRNRTNLNYFRDNGSIEHTKRYGIRYHAIAPGIGGSRFNATGRDIDFAGALPNLEEGSISPQEHNVGIFNISGRNGPTGVGIESNPIWVKIGYGMCLDATCGGN